MVDLSALSNEQLLQLRQQSSGVPDSPTTPGVKRVTVDTSNIGKPDDLTSMSDSDLLALRKSHPSLMDRVRGLGNAADAGVAAGVAGIGGALGDLTDIGAAGIGAATNFVERQLGMPESKAPDRSQSFLSAIPTSARLREQIQKDYYGGAPAYEPQNKAEEYAKTIGEFAPGAIGGAGRRVVQRTGQVVLPAVASETAGQATKGTAAEPYARFGGALAGGGASALLNRPSSASQAIRAQLPEGVTPQMVDQAEALIARAQQQGIDLAWPEALSQVAGRPVLTNTMRHLEAAPQTEAQMAEFFGRRPQQVEGAVRQELGNIAPINNAPSNIGPTIGATGERIVQDVRAAINRATRPSYDAAGQHLVPRQVHAAMMGDPLFVEALNRIRNDPARNSFVRGQSDRSIRVYDAVAKELEERASAAAAPMNPQASQAVASATGTLGGDIKDVAMAAERAATNGPSAYQAALANQTRFREQYLNPLLNGPLGKIAGRDTTTKNAIEALFPKQPLANSEHEIGTTVRALANRNPRAASDLVRAHIEGVFNEAAKDLQSGANQAGGAKFRVQLVGNPQQRLNLREAVEALPNGQERWRGFNNLLDALEATGTRQNVGSRTAYNTEALKEQSRSGLPVETVKAASNPLRGVQFLADRYERYRLGRNLGQLADILTDPGSANLLRGIARVPPGSEQAQSLALKLITYGESSGRTPVQKPNK